METNKIYQGNALEVLHTFPDESINCVMTSPPYWALRDYGIEGQIGLEKTFEEYITKLCNIFDEVKRVLRKDGTCWINLGDTYWGGNGGPNKWEREEGLEWQDNSERHTKTSDKWKEMEFKSKSLCLIPFRFAIKMQNRGWILRNVIIWHKPNCMPASVKDRFTVDFEYLFFFVKNKVYWFETQYEKLKDNSIERIKYSYDNKRTYDLDIHKKMGNIGQDQIRQGRKEMHQTIDIEQGRNKRTVWTITTQPFSEAHFATFPPELCETPIKSGCPENGIVLDPFCGAGTALLVAKRLGRNYVGIELNPEYCKIADDCIKSNREAFTMSVLKEVRSGKQKVLNEGGNFTPAGVVELGLNGSSADSPKVSCGKPIV